MELPLIKTKITYMDMTGGLARSGQDTELNEYTLHLEKKPNVEWYIDSYRTIGRDYIWNYRPGQTIEDIRNIIQSDNCEIYTLCKGDAAIGMAELDVSDPKNIEIVHFGLIPAFVGQGIGQKFLLQIITMLWARQPDRIWLSTCGLDHPQAISFYQNAGFMIFKTTDGVFKDYRYSDFYTLEDAPQIPHHVDYFNCQESC